MATLSDTERQMIEDALTGIAVAAGYVADQGRSGSSRTAGLTRYGCEIEASIADIRKVLGMDGDR